MSEQYRCTECGHFVEIQDDATCDVCHVGKMEHLRYIKGGAGSHWEGCEEVHWDCRIAQLETELARRDEIITRLKEDAEKLAENWMDRQSSSCDYCGRWYRFDYHEATYSCDHADNCPITLHRALMKELE